MAVLVVRHAHAGDRHRWEGPDEARPLTAKGREQAEGLVATLAGFAIERILSSPYRRCVETVAPLAAARGLVVEPCEDLAEGAGPAAVDLAQARDRAVLCTHGDVLLEILGGLGLPTDVAMRKGSTWVLEIQGGRVVDARYLDPPPRPPGARPGPAPGWP